MYILDKEYHCDCEGQGQEVDQKTELVGWVDQWMASHCKENGAKKSWLRDKPRVKGETFETAQYLERVNTLVCEYSFYPSAEESNNFLYGHVE